MKTPPKTSLNNQTLEEDIQLILDRMHHKIVHNETLKIDPPHKIDKTCPYKCTRDATKAILALVAERERLARVTTELKTHERYETVPVKLLRQHMTARKNILSALQPSNKETIQ